MSTPYYSWEKDLSKIRDIKCQLGKLYQMKDLRPTSSYLGIWITRDQTSWAIWIDQQAYIENTLKRFELSDANSTNTPLPAGTHLEKPEEPVSLNTKMYYQQIIGTLICAAISTRPNITFAATRLSWFNNNPTKEHIKYAKYILRYLERHKRTQDQIWWEVTCLVNWILRLGLGWKQRWSPLHIRTCFPDGKWCYILGILVTRNSRIVSWRSWIYGISQHWTTDWVLGTMGQQCDSFFQHCKLFHWLRLLMWGLISLWKYVLFHTHGFYLLDVVRV